MYANQTLGFIVPGLIAYQLVRQPKGATLLATGTVTLMAYVVLTAGILLGVMPHRLTDTDRRPTAMSRAKTEVEAAVRLHAAIVLALLGGSALPDRGTAQGRAGQGARASRPSPTAPAAPADGAETGAASGPGSD